MKELWDDLKVYFGDGFVPGSSPLRYNVHFCTLHDPAPSTDSTRYGVELPEYAMPLFSVLGDSTAPPCTCYDMRSVIFHIDAFLASAPDRFPNDYEITSGKDDADINACSLYSMRDTLSWWIHWGGSLAQENYWKLIYVALATIPDDVQIPPRDFVDGTYTYLGHTWDDCREGLLREGVPADQVKFAEMALVRQVITQYLEKVDPDLRSLLVSKTSLMTQYRVMTGNSLGCGVLFLASEGASVDGLTDDALEMASIAQCLSLDIAKEAMGVLEGEKTETVAGNRKQLKRELRWVYARCMKYLETDRNAYLLRRHASSGLHFVPMMDRYLERVRGNRRFPIKESLARLLEPYIRHDAVADDGDQTDGGKHIERVASESITVAP